MAEEGNLVYLLKFEKGRLEPAEEHRFCLEHYEPRKNIYKDYQVTEVNSSIPKLWCEICSPPDFGI